MVNHNRKWKICLSAEKAFLIPLSEDRVKWSYRQCRSVRWQNYWLRFLQKINKGRTHEKEKKKQPFRQKRSCRQKQPFRQKQNRIRTSRAGKDLNLVYLPCIIRKNGSTTKKECRICGNAGKWFRKVHVYVSPWAVRYVLWYQSRRRGSKWFCQRIAGRRCDVIKGWRK